MNPTVLRHYQNERAAQRDFLVEAYNTPNSATGRLPRINRRTRFAAAAWDRAKTKARFEDMESDGLVRIKQYPDSCDLEDLFGDTFDPEVNMDCKPHILDRQRGWELDRIERDGVFAYSAEIHNGREWIDVQSIGYVIGDLDPETETDLMNAAIKAHGRLDCCPLCQQVMP